LVLHRGNAEKGARMQNLETTPDFVRILNEGRWFQQGRGPRYDQIYRHLKDVITSGQLGADTLLPPEREMAVHADVSRVTIRKAIGQLADDGLVDQRQGSGTIVLPSQKGRLQQSLSSLVSFTETMQLRGYTSSSRVMEAGLHPPTPAETAALGLSGAASVARIKRLRIADTAGVLAIETSTLPADILPNPELVGQSLYEILRKSNVAPVRAIQRISAVNLTENDAALLNVSVGAAFLKINRTGYLETGRPVEFTTGLYRSDVYDFIAEVRLEDQA
jgi:GntR family transcriptional regulator